MQMHQRVVVEPYVHLTVLTREGGKQPAPGTVCYGNKILPDSTNVTIATRKKARMATGRYTVQADSRSSENSDLAGNRSFHATIDTDGSGEWRVALPADATLEDLEALAPVIDATRKFLAPTVDAVRWGRPIPYALTEPPTTDDAA